MERGHGEAKNKVPAMRWPYIENLYCIWSFLVFIFFIFFQSSRHSLLAMSPLFWRQSVVLIRICSFTHLDKTYNFHRLRLSASRCSQMIKRP